MSEAVDERVTCVYSWDYFWDHVEISYPDKHRETGYFEWEQYDLIITSFRLKNTLHFKNGCFVVKHWWEKNTNFIVH